MFSFTYVSYPMFGSVLTFTGYVLHLLLFRRKQTDAPITLIPVKGDILYFESSYLTDTIILVFVGQAELKPLDTL